MSLTSISKAERLPIKTYTVADGLLRDDVQRIKRDSRGFLWFCTGEGVSRFDGYTFTNFTTANGLPGRAANDFLEKRDGTIYIATDRGLARLNVASIAKEQNDPLFTSYLPDAPKAQKILALFEDKEGQVWVGTSDGLYKLIETGGKIAFEYVRLGDPLASAGAAIAAPEPNSLFIKRILEDRNGTLWVGTDGSGLFRLSRDGTVRRFTTVDGLGDNKITDLLEDADGRLWASLRSDESGGVCLFDPDARARSRSEHATRQKTA